MNPIMQVLKEPSGRGLAILAAHPEGCRVQAEIQRARAIRLIPQTLPATQGRTALVIGSTTFGLGSATLIALKAAGFQNVIGVGFEEPPLFDKETGAVRRASPGWYLTSALHQQGFVDRTYFANAFSDETRNRIIADLRESGLGIDALFYSVATPRRTYNGQNWASVLKVNGDPLDTVGVDYKTGKLTAVCVPAATPQERFNTIQVMGGADLELWVGALLSAGLLNERVIVGAYSYIGPQDLNDVRRVYWDGTIGDAKKDIDRSTGEIRDRLKFLNGKAFPVVFPAVVTMASAMIPAVVKYLAAYLGAAMTAGVPYLDPMDAAALMVSSLYGSEQEWRKRLDPQGRLRMDTDELDPKTQGAVSRIYNANTTPGQDITPEMRMGLEAFHGRHQNLFGFEVPDVDYGQPARFDVELTPAMGIVNLLHPELHLSIPVRALPAPPPTIPITDDEVEGLSQ